MRLVYVLALVFASAAFALLVDCGDTEGTGGTDGVGGLNTDTRIIVLREWTPEELFTAVLEGVEICTTGTDDCVRTNHAGRAVVEIPLHDEFSFTLEREGYPRRLLPDFQPTGLYLFPTFGWPPEERTVDLYERVMSPYPPQRTGTIAITADPDASPLACVGVAGMTFELSGSTGKVYYHDEDGKWDASLTETTCFGWGGFTEVPPGEVQVEIGGTAENCQVSQGWPGTIENSIRMPVRAGHHTRVRIQCNETLD